MVGKMSLIPRPQLFPLSPAQGALALPQAPRPAQSPRKPPLSVGLCTPHLAELPLASRHRLSVDSRHKLVLMLWEAWCPCSPLPQLWARLVQPQS